MKYIQIADSAEKLTHNINLENVVNIIPFFDKEVPLKSNDGKEGTAMVQGIIFHFAGKTNGTPIYLRSREETEATVRRLETIIYAADAV